MGYKEREMYVNRADVEKIFYQVGNAASTILLNGRIIGVWDISEKPDPLVKLYLFEKVTENVKNSIFRKAEEFGKFNKTNER
jgi:hypothetical protein